MNLRVKSICDILRRSNCAGALQYIPELTWLLFLRILDQIEEQEQKNWNRRNHAFSPSLDAPYRWRDWAAPCASPLFDYTEGSKRRELQAKKGALLAFVNHELIPHLKTLGVRQRATPRQKIISQIFDTVTKTCIDTEENLEQVLNRVHEIKLEAIDRTHIFPISQAYEGLLLKLGEKNSDGGQFFTPREIVRAMVQIIAPKPGETVYDPCCGTGGFLAQAYEFMNEKLGENAAAEQLDVLKRATFFGREKEDLVYPIALANLVLHGIDEPHLWHGNTLTNRARYDGLFQDAPGKFDVVLTNPPFGGKEGKDTQEKFAYKTSATQVLFLQHILDHLKPGGRCGIVVDEGVLFRTNDRAFVQIRRRLLEECNLWCIVSLPIGIFVNAGASIKTDLLFCTKGEPTKSVWYYDLSDVKVSKAKPFTQEHFHDLLRQLPNRALTSRSWSVPITRINKSNYDLKATNPNHSESENLRTSSELIALLKEESHNFARLVESLR